MNHASRYYGLKENPIQKISKMGKAKAKEMSFWTENEYLAFSEEMKKKPVSYCAFEVLYKADEDSRLFTVSKSYLHHEMDRGCKASGVKRIRIHDLRHSHVAHLIELGFSPVEIAERLGHESMAVTMTYSHLYPSKGRVMADRLGESRSEHQKGD